MEVGATADLLSGARMMVQDPKTLEAMSKKQPLPLPEVSPLHQRHAAQKIQALARGYSTRRASNKQTLPSIKQTLPTLPGIGSDETESAAAAVSPSKKKNHHHHSHKKRHHKSHHKKSKDGEETKKAPGRRKPTMLQSKRAGPQTKRTQSSTAQTEDEKKIESEVLDAHNLLAQVLDTKKGRGILVQEAKILKALREGRLEEIVVERDSPDQSLGLHFTVPSQVAVENWTTHQRLIVSNMEPESASSRTTLKIDDVVHMIDGKKSAGIDAFKELIKGKTKFTLTVARCAGLSMEDIRKVREDIEKQVTGFARKSAEESLRASAGV